MQVRIPPPASCPIGWQPAALTPVFYGARNHTPADGAPVPLRVFFPSLDGSVFTAPILDGCGRYPLILFVHGHCAGDVEHYKKWFHLPGQLARSGYVVVVAEMAAIQGGIHPSADNHPDLAALANVLAWIRGQWEHRDTLMPPPATGICGHSFGALVAARFGVENGGAIAAYSSLSGVHTDWPSGPFPIQRLSIPMQFIMGSALEDVEASLPDSVWNALPRPRHRAMFANGFHWDYLPAGQTPCDLNRGPCPRVAGASVDLVTMFFAKHLPPEFSPDMPDKIPDSLTPPELELTPEQEFYAGGHLIGYKLLAGNPECGISQDWAVIEQPDDGPDHGVDRQWVEPVLSVMMR
ncbi:MAG: hypothetical protein KIT09_36060 [Bryobacteraceae bacterium]|nr:hypothetical protein [Bryobacteraceae bacterium]